jgi:hypothetical protein
MSSRAVFCIAKSRQQAAEIARGLQSAGFSPDDVSVLLADAESTRQFATEAHTKSPEGATAGAGAGGILGGIAGWLAGIGTLAIPGVGPFVAAGPIMAALGGAAVGAGVGGVAGALAGYGVPEYEAKRYEGRVTDGGILVSVHTVDRNEQQRARDIFERAGAEDISSTSEASAEHPAH